MLFLGVMIHDACPGRGANTTAANARHQGKANVVFCDGHVESPTLEFLFEDTSDAALVRWNRDHLPHRDRLSPSMKPLLDTSHHEFSAGHR